MAQFTSVVVTGDRSCTFVLDNAMGATDGFTYIATQLLAAGAKRSSAIYKFFYDNRNADLAGTEQAALDAGLSITPISVVSGGIPATVSAALDAGGLYLGSSAAGSQVRVSLAASISA